VSALTAEALALYERVDREALPPASARSGKMKKAAKPVVMLAIALLVGAATATTTCAQVTAASWNSAVVAYRNRSYVDASEKFLQIVNAAPRDADALANWGIASWAAGDTVSAVIAWQRAVRLDPLADDLRENLLLLPSGARDGIAEIPMVPVSVFGYAGALGWIAGWGVFAWFLWRKRANRAVTPAVRVFAITAIVASAVSAGASAWGARQLRSTGLAVVVRPETMRSGPEGDTDALGGVGTGDVVRVEQQKQLWARVQHADGRQGWLPGDHLVPFLGKSLQ
jgi:hypothetical protein